MAYIVQASFNVTQVGPSFVFGVPLGLLCALSVGAGVPVSLRLGEVVGHRGMAPTSAPTSTAAGE